MSNPPQELDGAQVKWWSPLERHHSKTSGIRLFADGAEQSSFAGIAIAVYEKKSAVSGGAYLFYCDEHWEVQNDSLYHTIEEAKSHAERQFAGVAFTWRRCVAEAPNQSPDPTRFARGSS